MVSGGFVYIQISFVYKHVREAHLRTQHVLRSLCKLPILEILVLIYLMGAERRDGGARYYYWVDGEGRLTTE